MGKKYVPKLWDVQFCKEDKEGNPLRSEDGSIKLFTVGRKVDVSYISEYIENEDLEEI
tara:strand:- start:1533 stop:1706 length:174 start_codon:yes stop_codon:yes gene_type:complete